MSFPHTYIELERTLLKGNQGAKKNWLDHVIRTPCRNCPQSRLMANKEWEGERKGRQVYLFRKVNFCKFAQIRELPCGQVPDI